ncbi:hypothetical protein [Tellurirhabdus bombi]|uniref:hypothetical protein n=1 Tax=Tellurirhabdus bombi TaxID=2907205 RepID=UPI001F41F449|nr:hypothetical protein [Tellurirhabdus bombi]
MPIRTITTWFFLLLPIGLVSTVVLFYGINLPYWDDYMVQEHLLAVKSDTGGLWHKLGRLFDQHWEHRIVWTRSLFFIYYKLTGQLNYYGLTLLGVSGLPLIGLLFYLAFRRLSLPLYYFIPVCYWLFTLQSHENLLWAMASIQNFYVLVFALGAFYGLARTTRPAFIAALFLALLASFTSGNGFLVFVAGAIVLLWTARIRQAILWLIVGALAISGYFYGYYRVGFFPSPFKYGFDEWLKALFVFAGSFVDTYPYSKPYAIGYESQIWLTVLLGVLIISFAAYHLVQLFIVKRFFTRQVKTKTDLFWTSFFGGGILFLLGTAAMTVYARLGFGGADYMLQGRYKIYSPLFLSLCYLYFLWINRSNSHLFRYWIVILSVSVPVSLFASYQCLEGIINQRRKIIASYITWLNQAPAAYQNQIKTIFQTAQSLPFDPSLIRPNQAVSDTTGSIAGLKKDTYFYNLTKQPAINPDLAHPDEGSYVVLVGRDSSYVFAARPLRPYSVPDSLSAANTGGYFSKVFQAQIPKEGLKTGNYRLGILTNQNKEVYLKMTSVQIHHTSTF